MTGEGHWVLLAQHDLDRCQQIAERRNRPGLRDAHGFNGDRRAGLNLHLLGCLGELAFAYARGRAWDADVDTFKSKPDVGAAEVRTRSKREWDLIIRRDDDPSKPYVLVNGEDAPWFEIVGWIWGHEARRPEFLASHGYREPAYFVPRAELREIP